MILLMSCIIAIPILLQKRVLKVYLLKEFVSHFFDIYIQYNRNLGWKISFEGDSFSRDTILPPFCRVFIIILRVGLLI